MLTLSTKYLFLTLVVTSSAFAQLPLPEIGRWAGGPEDEVKTVAVVGDRAYVVAGKQVVVLDVSDRSHPIELGRSEPYPDPWRIAVNGPLLYAASGIGLLIFDVSNPSAIYLKGVFPAPCWYVAVEDQIAVLPGTGTVRIVDVSDPANPALLSQVAIGEPRQLWVQDQRVCVGGEGNTFKIIDVSDPRAPLVLGQYVGNEQYDVLRSGNLAYLVGEAMPLQILDITNPQAIASLSFVPGQDTADLALADGFVYTRSSFPGIRPLSVYDVARPTAPVLVLVKELTDFPEDIKVEDGHLWYPAAGRLNIRRALRRGDFDFDGNVTLADNGSFVEALIGQTIKPLQRSLADINLDGVVSGADIPVFVGALLN